MGNATRQVSKLETKNHSLVTYFLYNVLVIIINEIIINNNYYYSYYYLNYTNMQ